jgi:hypothetical protein
MVAVELLSPDPLAVREVSPVPPSEDTSANAAAAVNALSEVAQVGFGLLVFMAAVALLWSWGVRRWRG